MSVLFKALAKAAEANKARHRSAGVLPTSQPSSPSRPQSQPQPQYPRNPAPSRRPAAHSAMWQALSAAASNAGQGVTDLNRDFAPEPELGEVPAKRRFDLGGFKRLGGLGGRVRLSETMGRPSPRPFRIALMVLVTALGGTLGTLYYFGDDTLAIYEELMGDEPARQPPTPRKPKPIVQAPKPAETPVEPAQAEAPKQEPKQDEVAQAPAAPAAPETAVQPPAAPVGAPKYIPSSPAVSDADAAVDRVVAEAGRRTSQEKDIADKAAVDLPGLLADVRARKAQGAVTPQIDVRKASGTPSVVVPGGETKLDMVRVRTSSSQVREESEMAYARLMSGQFEGAAILYGEVLKREPRNLSALMGRAAALHKLGQMGEARGLYQQALAISPGNREVLANLMSLYGSEDPRDALRQLEMLQQDNPGFSPIPAQMANLYAQSGDLSAAIRYLGLAVQLAPENLLYRFNLAVMQDRAGMSSEAANSYETVLNLAARGSVAALPMPVGQVKERLSYLRTR
ncbi:TPR repeat protein (modular protein) [Rhodospirillaceae bacterium LM-1]|nr:TPR repeat protein (modular protein) [Rhodospirillaceae bacterium LM-1]